jgi:hypothetical protein
MAMETVSLLEGAQLELAGAGRRLALALQALADFDSEWGNKTLAPELLDSLAHQLDTLETEVDAARRRRNECAAQVAELKQER